MSSIFDPLLEYELDEESIDRARHKWLVGEFEKRLNKLLANLSVGPKVNALKDEVVEILKDGDLSIRRTEGIRKLSHLLIYSMADPSMTILAEGNEVYLSNLSLRTADQINQLVAQSKRVGNGNLANTTNGSKDIDWLNLYESYFPSTPQYDAHPDAEILLVGMAPGYVEGKTGIPLADLWNVQASNCASCANFQRCLVGTALLSSKQAYQPSKRLYGCEYEPAQDEFRIQESTQCYTAGEVLRRILEKLSIGRASWKLERAFRTYAICTNVYRYMNREWGDKDSRNAEIPAEAIKSHAGWLWLEAAMVQPRATVLLGRVAAEGYKYTTGFSKSTLRGFVDLNFPFGAVYYTFHPSYLFRSGNRLFQNRFLDILDSEIQKAVEEPLEQRQLHVSEIHQFRAELLHFRDTLDEASRCKPNRLLYEEAVGRNNILPTYIVHTTNKEDNDDSEGE